MPCAAVGHCSLQPCVPAILAVVLSRVVSGLACGGSTVHAHAHSVVRCAQRACAWALSRASASRRRRRRRRRRGHCDRRGHCRGRG
eukprot:5884834-Pleurochrysis_carterae.AAC.1